ncbi:MAG: flagellar protein FlgN [Gammaproteobacteria bacterium]|jgi:flagellar biosynthesis/type III secretory pathway chaperone|nr:flagellar protein FlgN [Gammaproteobacteria bacterium]
MAHGTAALDCAITPWEDLVATGEELLGVLDDERDALLGRDPALLERTVARKLALLGFVEEILKAHAAAPRGPDVDAPLRARANAVLEEAVRRNELNARIAAQREVGIRKALDVLTGRHAAPSLYGPAGRSATARGGQAIGVA